MQIIEQKTKGARPAAKQLKIDMTPMVDLGFLLISFFIFTTTLGGHSAMKLYMPADGPSGTLKASHAITALLSDDNQVVVFSGDFAAAKRSGSIIHTNYDTRTGFGGYIRSKMSNLRKSGDDPSNLMVLIKPTEKSSYKNLINALDELTINGITRYAIVEPEKTEAALIQ